MVFESINIYNPATNMYVYRPRLISPIINETNTQHEEMEQCVGDWLRVVPSVAAENTKVLTTACHLQRDSLNAIISDGPDLGCAATVTFVADRGRFVVRVYLEFALRTFRASYRSLDHLVALHAQFALPIYAYYIDTNR